MKKKCIYCKGTGYSGRVPVKCSCKLFCYKCEMNEGYVIKPNELCDYCSGSGDESVFYKIICTKEKKSNIN